MAQAHIAVKKPLHVTFVDLKKAFDSVIHTKMLDVLQDFNAPADVLRLIANLYSRAKGTLTWKGLSTPMFKTPVGVRQGCPLSPTIFNLYTEAMMREWTRATEHLVPPDVEGFTTNELRYADDIALLALSANDAEIQLQSLGVIASQYGLQLHPDKTEYMVIQPTLDNLSISYNGTAIKRVTSFRYLGSVLSYNTDDSVEIRSRIAMAKQSINQCSYIKSTHIDLEVKMLLIKSLVMAKLTYGASTWTMKKNDLVALDAFGRTIWRRLLGLTWSDRISNDHLQHLIGDRWLFSSDTILEQQAKWHGHCVRKGLAPMMSGLPSGARRSAGRPRARWMDGLKSWSGLSASDLATAGWSRILLQKLQPDTAYSMTLRSASTSR